MFLFPLRPPPPTSKAPMAHPHTIDPFREVKEYMMEAEDYSHSLLDKISVCLPENNTVKPWYFKVSV
ncbi:hypothetical protein DPMN_007372 [Dreissena polymorpha]|uniref:Uncharacterized protein n=1 Tax=Dreissena polymorpha TaxID=45954 RepID=A0A9D4MT60_DREPO|nr:hypothetical protein DPMN_007372 [Dreissena polymorpha]